MSIENQTETQEETQEGKRQFDKSYRNIREFYTLFAEVCSIAVGRWNRQGRPHTS